MTAEILRTSASVSPVSADPGSPLDKGPGSRVPSGSSWAVVDLRRTLSSAPAFPSLSNNLNER